MKRSLLFHVLLTITVVVFLSCGGDSDPALEVSHNTPEVGIVKPSQRDIVVYTKLSGALEPNRFSMIDSNVEGYVEEVLVDIGDDVLKGDTLLKLRQIDFDLASEQVEKALKVTEKHLLYILAGDRPEIEEVKRLAREVARAKHTKAESQYQRMKTLLEDGVISKEEFEETEEEYKIALAEWQQEQKRLEASEAGPTMEEIELARAEYARAQSALNKVRQDKSDSIIKAPFDGTITGKYVEVGQRIDTSGADLFELSDITSLRARLYAPEHLADVIHTGQKVSLSIKSNGNSKSGTITRVNKSVDPETHTFLFEVTIPNKDLKLKSGLFSTARIPEKTIQNALALPKEAVIRSKGLSYVQLLEEGHVKTTQIQTGVESEGWIEVKSGLDENAEVATGTIEILIDGQEVTIKPESTLSEQGQE